MTRAVRTLAAFGLLMPALGGASLAAAEPRAQRPPALRAPIVLPLARASSHHRTISVRVGRDTVDFILDTGGGITLVDSTLAARIGCTRIPRSVGFRMTGERVGGPRCAGVALGVGPLTVRTDVGVMNVARLVGDTTGRIKGILALDAFAGRTITLDLPHDRLIVETPASAAARARSMRRVPMRIATGQDGASLGVFVGLTVPGAAAPLWLEWDSGHGATTVIAPGALAIAGQDSAARAAELHATFDGRDTLLLPVQRKDVIYDGVLSAAAIERATWTVDLARGAMSMSAFEPFPALPATVSASVAAPTSHPEGVYEFTITVGDRNEPAALVLRRDRGRLVGDLREMGSDDVIRVRDLAFSGDTLSFTIPLRRPIAARLVFVGLHADGTWTGPEHSGPAVAEKRR